MLRLPLDGKIGMVAEGTSLGKFFNKEFYGY